MVYWGVIEGRAVGALDKDKREEQKAKAMYITKEITAQSAGPLQRAYRVFFRILFLRDGRLHTL